MDFNCKLFAIFFVHIHPFTFGTWIKKTFIYFQMIKNIFMTQTNESGIFCKFFSYQIRSIHKRQIADEKINSKIVDRHTHCLQKNPYLPSVWSKTTQICCYVGVARVEKDHPPAK